MKSNVDVFSLSCSSPTLEPDQVDADNSDGYKASEVDSHELEADAESEEVSLRNLTNEKKQPGDKKTRSAKSSEKKSNVEKVDKNSDQKSLATKPDFQRPELWKLADSWELVQHYRKKSNKAQQRFVLHEKELPPDHRRDPEDQAYIDSLDSVNEPAVDLAEEAILEAAAQIQLMKQQQEKSEAEALAQIAELKKTLKDTQSVANETLIEVKAGRVVANKTHDMVVNNTKALMECLGRPTLEMWVQQGWDALWGKVPAEASFFRPTSIGQWFEPQILAMALIWIVSFVDARSGSRLSKKLNVCTPGWAKVVIYSETKSGKFNLSSITKGSWRQCDSNSFTLPVVLILFSPFQEFNKGPRLNPASVFIFFLQESLRIQWRARDSNP